MGKKQPGQKASGACGGSAAGGGGGDGPALPPFLKAGPAGACLITVRATPGAKTSSIMMGAEAVEVRIDAPPVEGKANEAICAYMAEVLGLKKRAVSLSAGAKSRDKVVLVEGLGAPAALERLKQQAEAG